MIHYAVNLISPVSDIKRAILKHKNLATAKFYLPIKNYFYLAKNPFNKLSKSSTFSATAVSWFCTLCSVLNTAVA